MKLVYSRYCFPCQSFLTYFSKAITITNEELSPVIPDKKNLNLTEWDRKTLGQVKEFIEAQDVDVSISLKVLCRKFALNEFKLKKGFRQLFKYSPYDYFLELKMAAAKKLLMEADTTVYGVAYTLGYHHVSNFCAQFKKRFGVTPKGFKR